MKRLMVVWAAVFVIAGAAQLAAFTELSQAARAKIEDDLYRRLTPLVGVFDYVAFKLDADGTLTLLGQLKEPPTKQRVEAEAKKAEGIKQVRNQVEILPASSTDEKLRQSLYRAIYEQKGYTRYKQQKIPPIHIIVKNGSLILEGAVMNQQEYNQVNSAVKSVSGVTSVKNNLRIDPAA